MDKPTSLAEQGSGLLLAVEELGAVHDRYDSLRSDNAGSGGDDPWPGGDGNLHESA